MDPYLFEMETRYFGFDPVQFVDLAIVIANETIYLAAERFLTILHGSEESSQLSPFSLEEGLLKLLTLLESNVDKHFDVFELYVLTNIFRLPENFLRNERTENPSEDETTLRTALDIQRQDLTNIKRSNMRLQTQLSRLTMIHSMFRSIHSKFSEIRDCIDKETFSEHLARIEKQVHDIQTCIDEERGREKQGGKKTRNMALMIDTELDRCSRMGSIDDIEHQIRILE